ncbi:hypothetical protein B0H13DRAFT_1907416 [Mycena leptocephala]|nr:hypothetical protein B0H13DRAFT_1907416 [Mycena leptocephala]
MSSMATLTGQPQFWIFKNQQYKKPKPPTLAVVKGSGNVDSAANLARDGSEKEVHDIIDMQVRPDFQLSGAKLSTLTQATAYRVIKELRETVHRKSTDENIRVTQEAVKLLYKKTPTAAAIWKSIRNQDISRQIKISFGKQSTVHTASGSSGQISQKWKVVLTANTVAFSRPWTIFCSIAHAQVRLRILITESLYLIWKLRCECVISRDGEAPSENEIHNRWVSQINERLSIDRALTNRIKFSKQYSLAPSLVLDTWKGSLLDEDKLPKDWLRDPEVLGDEAGIDNGTEPHNTVAIASCVTHFLGGWKPFLTLSGGRTVLHSCGTRG